MGTPDLPISARGIWPSGPMKGLQAHGNFQVDGPDWGINHPDTKISPPLFSTEKAIQASLTTAQRDEALSWNLLMYDDGSVSEQSLAIMQAAGSAVRKIYPNWKSDARDDAITQCDSVERTMQHWADYLDSIKAGVQVVRCTAARHNGFAAPAQVFAKQN